jgi:TetR/AcrR family transcriptional regulator
MVIKHQPKQRARTDQAKEARREQLLTVAAELWAEKNFSSITMFEVASRAQLAKGTTYLYFQTKEELLLALLERELQAWFLELGAKLSTKKSFTPKEFAQLISKSLVQRQAFMRLICIQSSILEHNIGLERALEFKSFLFGHALNAATLIEAKLEFLKRGEGIVLLQRINAFIIGFYDLTNPSQIIQTVLEKPTMKPFRLDFSKQFQSTLETLLIGLETQRRTS